MAWAVRFGGKEDMLQSKSTPPLPPPPDNTCHLSFLTGMDLLETGLRSDLRQTKNVIISLIFFHLPYFWNIEFTVNK